VKTHLDLFSGIGGFALAAGWAGYNTIGFCEIEDYPRRVLSKRFSGVPIHGDIRELDGSVYRGVSLITGGYPCQPFSAAGKRGGASDDRHLWPQMLRVIKQARPVFVVAENVAGHITLGLDEVLADLEGEGYAGRAIVVPACAVNAPHRRDRVWVVARDVAHSNSSGMERPRSEQQTAGVSRAGEDVAHSEIKRTQGLRTSGVEESPAHAGQEVPLCSYERIGSSYWEAEPAVGRVADGIPDRVDRLKGLGNAIVPQVAYELIRHLETHG
jgi:DNA (cytosine-5)-methyltransferase 1